MGTLLRASLLTSIALGAGSCGLLTKQLDIQSHATAIERDIHPRPLGVESPDINWDVEALGGKLKAVLSIDEWQALAKHQAKRNAYDREANSVIDAYEADRLFHNEQAIKPPNSQSR